MKTNDHSLRSYDSMLGLLSNEENPTPIVRLNRVVPFKHTQIFAKLEWYNPFGAVKDRVAANLIQDAEERGILGPGKKLVEATSGNTGIGLIMMGNAKGYELQTPLSDQIPLEKRTVLRFLGTDVIELDDSLCPAPGAPEGAIAKARATAVDHEEYEILDQYVNEANPGGHYLTTGPEIWRQTQGKVTHFIAGLGTCGTITGTGRFLKEKDPNVKILGVCPEEGHDIPGVRSQRQLQQTKLYRPDEYDGQVEVSDREAYEMCLRINREESIIAGPSSGMNLVGALKMLPDEPGMIAVVIFCDNIFKYASSVARHFPDLTPPKGEEAENTGPSKNDIFLAELIENLKNPHDTIRVKNLNELLESENAPVIIDIRNAEMFSESHIPGSINIPQDDLAKRSDELPEDRDSPIITVCNIGKFSKHATLFLKSKGYRSVKSAKGGLNEWVRKGYATSDPAKATSED
ncbi:MAG: pyridoxal-phosphate dependent enzyme [Planctomycetaceae bacterium]|nr:pyridoxal-phosphate dependent enzyme [Planctomycetaceae bacterium]